LNSCDCSSGISGRLTDTDHRSVLFFSVAELLMAILNGAKRSEESFQMLSLPGASPTLSMRFFTKLVTSWMVLLCHWSI